MHRTKREAVPKTIRAGIAAWRICRYLTWTQPHANKAVEAGIHTSFVHSSIIVIAYTTQCTQTMRLGYFQSCHSVESLGPWHVIHPPVCWTTFPECRFLAVRCNWMPPVEIPCRMRSSTVNQSGADKLQRVIHTRLLVWICHSSLCRSKAKLHYKTTTTYRFGQPRFNSNTPYWLLAKLDWVFSCKIKSDRTWVPCSC